MAMGTLPWAPGQLVRKLDEIAPKIRAQGARSGSTVVCVGGVASPIPPITPHRDGVSLPSNFRQRGKLFGMEGYVATILCNCLSAKVEWFWRNGFWG